MGAFVFQSRKDEHGVTKREESVAWAALQEPDITHQNGHQLAARKNEQTREKKPNIPEEDLDYYHGFCVAKVQEIRESEPGLFNVFYDPTTEDDSHCALFLTTDFLEMLRERYRDVKGHWEDLNKAVALKHAQNVLANVFRKQFVPDGHYEPTGPALIEAA